MCSYDRAYIINNAINSILEQDYDDWELIIVDDGSKDNTKNVILDFIENHNRNSEENNYINKKNYLNKKIEFFEILNLEDKAIIDETKIDKSAISETSNLEKPNKIYYHYQNNSGITKARNKGIDLSSGKFITFLDSDDEYKPNHLSSRFEVIKQTKCDFLHNGVEIIGNEFVPDKNDKSKLISIKDCVVGGTFFISRKIIDEIGKFEIVDYSDDSCYYEKVLNSKKYKIVNLIEKEFETYVYNRNSSDSICNTINL